MECLGGRNAVGRWARVAEAQGTRLGLVRNEAGSDVETGRGKAWILSLEE